VASHGPAKVVDPRPHRLRPTGNPYRTASRVPMTAIPGGVRPLPTLPTLAGDALPRRPGWGSRRPGFARTTALR
jgi:hypothetical protein